MGMPGEILNRLDAFIRKYYLNQLIRGGLLSVGLLLGLFLVLSFSEYVAYFPVWVRSVLFFGLLFTIATVLWFWVVKPLMGMYRLGKSIDYAEAAKIIGNHFGQVQDKLLNLLQLEEMAKSHPDSGLLLAGIEQKTRELKPVPFSGAINLKANKKYLRFALPPLMLLLVLVLFQSHIITDGSKRLFHFNTHFERKAPFAFVLKNKTLQVERGGGILLELAIEGRALPDEVFVNIKGQAIRMQKNEKGLFTYMLSNIQQDVSIVFQAMDFSSKPYQVKLLPMPVITEAEALLTYPAYTGKASETVVNTTEYTVPEGTSIQWRFRARDAQFLQVSMDGKNTSVQQKGGWFAFGSAVAGSMQLVVLPVHKGAGSKDTLRYQVISTPDLRPEIQVEKKDDSANVKRFWFIGNASDDYAVSRVMLKYRFTESAMPAKMQTGWIALPMNAPAGGQVSFVYAMDMDAIGMAPGDAVEYYFEAWDNDGLHGSKSSKTATQALRRQTLEEVRKEAEKTGNKVQEMMEQVARKNKQLQQEAQELQQRLNSRKNMAYEDKERIEDFMKKQEKMEEQFREMKQQQEKLQQQKEEFLKQKPESLERKQQMEELLKQMDNPEMRKLMEEIQKLMEQKASKEKISEKMNELQQQNKEQAKDLNQLMEQFKELQLEQKLNDNMDRLSKLAEKQEKLAAKTQQEKGDKEGKLKQEQEKLSKEMQDIKMQMKEALKMNQELEKPMNLDLGEKEQQQAETQQKEAEDQLQKGKNSKAGESQKEAAEQMKKAVEKMQKSMEQEQQKRLEEDYQKLRVLLENLVETSVLQEDIFTALSAIREYNPRFVDLNKKQMEVREKCAQLEDSLRALAKRQPMVSTFVSKEISRINTNMDAALKALKIRALGDAGMREQYVMTGLNNLAVMLLESMQNMQQKLAQQNQKQGKGSCSNPGGKGKSKGKPNKGDKLSKGQEQLGQMLQEMQKKGQQGKPGTDGQPKPGEGMGQKEMNKEYAKIALMQEAMRRQLGALRKAMENGGNGSGAKSLKETEKLMEQQERELVNKRLDPTLMQRQKEIETRLLEHEKAERTQETDEQRQAAAPESHTPTVPPALQQYIQQKKAEREALRKVPAELVPYFKDKVNTYLQKIQ